MFTGIIEEVGQLDSIQKGSQFAALDICCKKVLKGTGIGDSIAVNGVCLTVTALRENGFRADVMAETIERSSLGQLRRGSRINLERAMPADGRFGGHMVAGHVDGVGIIRKVSRDEIAVWYEMAAAPELLRYIVEKGSIAIDGISLTVARVGEHTFGVSVIPHTQKHTTLIERVKGDIVNLETDVVGKYVEKLLRTEQQEQKAGRLTPEFLAEHGF